MKNVFLFILTLLIISCGKDDASEKEMENPDMEMENVELKKFIYADKEYEFKDQIILMDYAYSFEIEKDIIGNFTLIFSDGRINREDWDFSQQMQIMCFI